ncbi:MAG TPA: 6-pyruvoyl-tetrahydropterin synthase-related protein, partial [Pyrinomonadaceae bacterium]|nr:6-pyruvoyl-tetrahydropterin synthase-related protein [Pyrinomonadaceae bacterium]
MSKGVRLREAIRALTRHSSLIRHHSSLFLVAIAGFAALVPALIWGIPAGPDLPSHLRFAQPFYNAISAGILHPGWGAESNGGFGDPGIRFYPPALYYLLAVTRAISGNWYNGLLLGFILLSILGAFGAYFWARCFLPRNLAIVAGVLYAFVPYHVNEFYGASLLAEYAAASIAPFAFAFVVRVCRNQRLRDIAGLAMAFALLLLTNLPVAVIASLSLPLYALLNIEKKTWRRTLPALIAAVAFGLAASAFYWTTMIAELSWLKNAALVPTENLVSYFDYRRNFVLSPFALGNTNSWLAAMFTLATLSMAFAPLVMFCSSYRKQLSRGLIAVF